MYTCKFCGFHSEELEDFEEDYQNQQGFWCPYCDGFTYYKEENRAYTLILEDKDKEYTHKPATFPVHCSPLRYPGGKSKLVGAIIENCRKEDMQSFIEPFAGGASVGLSLLLSHNTKGLYLNDIDFGIYSLFYMIKYFPDVLIKQILLFKPSKEDYLSLQHIVLNHYENCDIKDAAWALLVTNRLAFSGIPYANCMSNPEARWNANTLKRRIEMIYAASASIHLSNINALEYIEEMYWRSNATLFIDPPYYDKGKKLYTSYYTEKAHRDLAFLLDELHKGFPGADMIITYDYQKEIQEMYAYPATNIIGRHYCIAN